MPEKCCKNCNGMLPPRAEFCPACGQSVKEFSRPWFEFVRESITELFDFDGRMLQSLRLLLTRPGFLSLEFINGRRVSHTSPIRLYLVVSLVFFFVLPMILPDVQGADASHDFSVDLYSRAMFLLLPLFALLLKAFYRHNYYLSHLVFAVHLFSAMFIVFAFLLSIETLADHYIAAMVLQIILFLYMLAYFVRALSVTYGESTGRSILKFLGLMLVFLPILGISIELVSH